MQNYQNKKTTDDTNTNNKSFHFLNRNAVLYCQIYVSSCSGVSLGTTVNNKRTTSDSDGEVI